MKTPFFSIIVPTYNAVTTISTCLESILNQTFQNFEIIIMDGISNDGTLDIVKRYSNKNSKIRIITNKDKGIYDAMNKGIEIANGKWIIFLGSDDKLFKFDVLLKIENYITEQPYVDVIYGNVFSTRFNGVYDGEFSPKKLLIQNICHQAIFFKREVFKKIGVFKLQYASHADWEHNFRWFLSKKIKKKYIDFIVADYSDGGFSSTHPDHLFYRDKHLKFIFYGHRILSFKDKLSMLNKEFRESVKYRDIKKVTSVFLHIPYLFY